MPVYQYEAIKRTDNKKVTGTINADNERQARELLREQELNPRSVKLLKENAFQDKQKKLSFSKMIADRLASVGSAEVVSFTQNLEMMVRSGIPLTEAMLYMETYMENPKFKRLLNRLRLDILSGDSFSRALTKHPKVFGNVYVSIVEAGEASGELETVLKRLSHMLIGQAKLKKKVISAMVYPAMVVVIATLVILIMFIFVLPTFSDMYDKMGIELPLITKIMVAISDFMRAFWYICIAGAVAGGFSFKKYAQSETGKVTIDKWMLKIPVVAPLVTAVNSSHFISTLNVSFSAGLPITDCMYMATQTVSNSIIRKAFDEVNLKIQSGQRLASAIADSGILPPMVVIMLSTGEESGALDTMLANSLDYLEGEVNQRVDILMSMMEPVLLVVLGVITGTMALSVYLPLFGMYENM